MCSWNHPPQLVKCYLWTVGGRRVAVMNIRLDHLCFADTSRFPNIPTAQFLFLLNQVSTEYFLCLPNQISSTSLECPEAQLGQIEFMLINASGFYRKKREPFPVNLFQDSEVLLNSFFSIVWLMENLCCYGTVWRFYCHFCRITFVI